MLQHIYGLLQSRLLAFDTDPDVRANDELLLTYAARTRARVIHPSSYARACDD